MVKIPRRGYKLVKSLFGQYEEIPEEWQIFSLTHKDILKLSSGKSISNIQSMGDYPVYGSNGIIGYTTQYNNDDSILIGRVGASGSIHYLDHEAWVTDNVLIAKVSKKLEKEFCVYALSYLNLGRFATKSAQPLLTQAILKIVKIKIPTLQEQQKIASILSGVDALIESAQKTIEKTERLKKGLMQQLLARGINHKKFKSVKWLFGKEIQIPEEWEMSTIEGISKKLVSGGTPSTTILEYWNGDIPWTRSSILLDPYLKSGEKFITSEGLKNSSSVLIPKNNLLVSSRVSVGNISINAIDIAISQDVTGIIINKSYAQLEFLYWYLKQYIKKLVLISQGTTIKGFTRKELANLLIFLPSLSEQQKIASILSGVDAYIQKNQQYKERLEKLKKGLMQKLLTGQIRVKV